MQDRRPIAARARPVDGARRLVLAAAAGACLAGWPRAGRSADESARVRASRALMGTRVDIVVQGADPALQRAAVEASFERMAFLAAQMSHYSATSRVAAVNMAAGVQPVEVPRDMMRVLRMAQDLSACTGGAFDVTVGSLGRWHFDPLAPQMPAPATIERRLPIVGYRHLVLDEHAGTAYLQRRGMRLDLGGIAKLYILEAGLDVLREHGLRTACINGGGDVVAITAPGAAPWRIGIRDPRRPGQLLATLDMRSGFVASSGDYERFFVRDGRRYHHVLDPRTGYPTRGPRGVTLVGETLQAVNGLGAAAMVLGNRGGPNLIARTPRVQGLLAESDGALWISPGLRERLVAPGSLAG